MRAAISSSRSERRDTQRSSSTPSVTSSPTCGHLHTALEAPGAQFLPGPAHAAGTIGDADRHPRAPLVGPSASRPKGAAGSRKARSPPGPSQEVGVVIYAGVCRKDSEPATACAVAAPWPWQAAGSKMRGLRHLQRLPGRHQRHHRRRPTASSSARFAPGLVVSCESAREINEGMIARMLEGRAWSTFKAPVATLTGGSGAVAVCSPTAASAQEGTASSAARSRPRPSTIGLCRWDRDFMRTDAAAVLKNGSGAGQAHLARGFLKVMDWTRGALDKDHLPPGRGRPSHRDPGAVGIPADKDFPTFEYLGNIGTVSLPLTAAIADERDFPETRRQGGFYRHRHRAQLPDAGVGMVNSAFIPSRGRFAERRGRHALPR